VDHFLPVVDRIAYCLENRVSQHIREGNLGVILPDWSPVEPAMYLYYPGHRRIPQGLRELIDVLREEISLVKNSP